MLVKFSGIDRENEAKQDHDEFVKSIKMEIKMKQDQLNEVLTTPKQIL
mgnify:CR=1 FL=1